MSALSKKLHAKKKNERKKSGGFGSFEAAAEFFR